jgi:hypothetical protein
MLSTTRRPDVRNFLPVFSTRFNSSSSSTAVEVGHPRSARRPITSGFEMNCNFIKSGVNAWLMMVDEYHETASPGPRPWLADIGNAYIVLSTRIMVRAYPEQSATASHAERLPYFYTALLSQLPTCTYFSFSPSRLSSTSHPHTAA